MRSILRSILLALAAVLVVLAAAAGLYIALTGIFGYCPACAMVGRKPIDEP